MAIIQSIEFLGVKLRYATRNEKGEKQVDTYIEINKLYSILDLTELVQKQGL